MIMGRQKKPKKKKSIQRSELDPKLTATATSLFQKFEGADPAEFVARVPDSRHAQAIIERVTVEENPSIPLLVALKDGFQDKRVQKAFKLALYKLKQKGIPVEEFSTAESSPSLILTSPQKEKPAAYVGPILNMFGSRAVLITHDKTTKGRHMAMGLISDEEGIHEFRYGTSGKKRTREMIEHLSKKAGPLVETSLSHAATVVENAYRRTVEKRPEPPPDYLAFRPWLLENAILIDHPVIYDFVAKDQIQNKFLTDSQLKKLFQHKLMETWVIEFERLQPFVEKILKADDSPIVLSDGQKSDQAKRIKEKCAEELFPSSEQALLRHRLEEMAFVFFKLEEDEFYRLCLGAARIIDHEGNSLQQNPVIEFFLERSLDYYMTLLKGGAPEDPGPPDSLSPSIIIP